MTVYISMEITIQRLIYTKTSTILKRRILLEQVLRYMWICSGFANKLGLVRFDTCLVHIICIFEPQNANSGSAPGGIPAGVKYNQLQILDRIYL
jgi:hypothetical protein